MTGSFDTRGDRLPDNADDVSPRRRDSDRMSRRKFTAVGGSTLAWAACAGAQTEVRPADDGPRRHGHAVLLIDLRRCTGCHACAVACKAEHGVRLGGFRSWISEREFGRYPNVTREFLPRMCNHCQDPPCQKVCPTGATTTRRDGIVTVDPDRCIGCRHCMGACPYNARYFNPQRDPDPEQQLFPARTHGTVDKCDLCTRRVDAGEGPACVTTCPATARIFGDADDLESDLARILNSEPTIALLDDLGTRPSVLYLGGRPDSFRRG